MLVQSLLQTYRYVTILTSINIVKSYFEKLGSPDKKLIKNWTTLPEDKPWTLHRNAKHYTRHTVVLIKLQLYIYLYRIFLCTFRQNTNAAMTLLFVHKKFLMTWNLNHSASNCIISLMSKNVQFGADDGYCQSLKYCDEDLEILDSYFEILCDFSDLENSTL